MDETRDRARMKLLALAACCCLAGVEELAVASRLAPRLPDRLLLARMSARRLVALHQLDKQLAAAGGSVADAMEPFLWPVDSLGRHARAAMWCEQAVKLELMGALGAHFVTEVESNLDEQTRALLRGCIDGGDHAHETERMVREALAEDPDLQGRMTLFGRRLLGESLGQAQRVAAAHPDLTGLLTGIGNDGDDLAAISELMGRIAAAHTRRMGELGLG